MSSEYTPINSETLVFIGAGATATLGMPSTYGQTEIFRKLSETETADEAEVELSKYFSSPDLEKIICFLNLLDGSESSIFEVSDADIANAVKIYGNHSEILLRNRILELRTEYDWNAAKKILKICPHNDKNDNLICDAYSIIDRKLISGQSLKLDCDTTNKNILTEEIIYSQRLQGARNFLTLFINMLFASAWNKITHDEKSEEFEKYKKFINSFDRLMQKEAVNFHSKKYPFQDRSFYLFSTSFVSFNFEIVFPWIFMQSHRELNQRPPYFADRPLKLWLDYACEHRGRKTDDDGNVISTLEFTEAVASRENEDGTHIGSELNRAGKFYFAHGSSAWRECPVCGRMTFYFGYSKDKWNYKSRELIPPFPIPIFNTIDERTLTKSEISWRKFLRYDSLQCMHCGAETKASDAPMIMQTMYKSTPTSFLEEIQRNVKVSLEKARHIVLLGYRLPPDDTIWYQAFSEAVRSRAKTDNAAFCTVVVGHKGQERWIHPDELENYLKLHRKADDVDVWGVKAIENACAIFGKEKVRAWTGGIPQVFGTCTENDVKNLFYPDFVNWTGTRLE
ncbi:MAG: hypothetical protein IJT42_01395 [Treponema sp.]|nr:hypothetical protein [Treponema sp.]